MKNNIRLKIRDFVRRGGRRVTEFQATSPQVSATSPSDQLNMNIKNQQDDYEKSFAEEALNDVDKNEESNSSLESEQNLNGLENFGVEDEAEPDLFSSDNNEVTSETFLSTENNEKVSDDDLETPAFLRRQKN